MGPACHASFIVLQEVLVQLLQLFCWMLAQQAALTRIQKVLSCFPPSSDRLLQPCHTSHSQHHSSTVKAQPPHRLHVANINESNALACQIACGPLGQPGPATKV